MADGPEPVNSAKSDRPAAVIAGAGGTLGQAAARALARKGFEVWCGWHKSEGRVNALASELGGRAVRLSAQEDPAEVLEEIFQKRQRLDVLVNASGINIIGPALGLDDEDWHKVFDLNFSWARKLSAAALRIMLPQKGGRIIHLSSSAARLGGRGQLNYAVSKAALERLVKGLALEAGPRGVLINAVAPGVIESPMTERIIAQHSEKLLDRISSRRFGRPEEVAEVIAFLAGPEAGYINGTVIAVDGGLW
ncbi:MAG: SDR family oxidoreductase [Deltaproteobacteria bacterium]|nr:SDR family oxidoreductase [Deltaproteobacteria bacterium]